MDEPKPDPIFDARRLNTAPGWFVRVMWRYGQREHVSGFASEHDAQKWIEQKSEAQLRGRKGARLPFRTAVSPRGLAVNKKSTP